MITSAPDFIGEYNIPNRSDAQTAELINGFIAKYEPQLLTELLGADLYALLKAGKGSGTVTSTATLPAINGSGTSFLTYFVVGDEITINDETHVISSVDSDILLHTSTNWVKTNGGAEFYKGEKWYNFYNLPSLKVAIICYVYYWFRRDAVTSFSGTGEIISNNENSSVVSPITKMVDRWNEMVRNNYATVKFIDDHTTDYGTYYKPEWLWYPAGWRQCAPDIFITQNTLNI